MTNLKTKLTAETLKRTNRIFNVDSITFKNDTLTIKSENSMSLDWAKYIAAELAINCYYVEFKTFI